MVIDCNNKSRQVSNETVVESIYTYIWSEYQSLLQIFSSNFILHVNSFIYILAFKFDLNP